MIPAPILILINDGQWCLESLSDPEALPLRRIRILVHLQCLIRLISVDWE